MSPLPARLGSVLFVCSLNAVRSPMAEAIAKQLYGRRIFVESAGLTKDDRDPFAIAALAEIGISLGDDEPKVIDEVDFEGFDLVVALSTEAHHKVQALCRATAMQVLFWPLPDASAVDGSRDQRMDAFRQVRDEIRARVRREIGPRVVPQGTGGSASTG